MVFVLCLQTAVATAPLHQADERAHVGYAEVLYRGQLPTIDTLIPADPNTDTRMSEILAVKDEPHRAVWVANHPPLFYLLSLPLVALGDATGHPGVTYFGMRILNGIGLTLTVLLVGLIARELVPRRPAVPLLGAAVALSCGSIPYRGGGIYNDGLSTVTMLWVVLLALRMVRTGVTPGRIALITAAATASVATRSTGVIAVALACLVVVGATWLHRRNRAGLLRGLVAGFLVGIVPVVAIAWFYLRNIRLYGDPTASTALFEKFGREPSGTTLGTLLDPRFHWRLLESLWVDERLLDVLVVVPVLLIAILLAAAVVEVRAVCRERIGWWKAHERRTRGLAPEDWWAWMVAVGYTALVVASVGTFIAGGGWIHARYAMPLLPLTATLVALAVLRLGRAVAPDADPEVREWRVTYIFVGVMLAAALVAHVLLLTQLSGPVHTLLDGGLVVIGDAIVLAAAVALARALRVQPVQSESETISISGPGRSKASGYQS
ncbi:hypothetical protein GCM10007979_43690 [Nocardioides albus]|nr:hypothetical protein GCM10007979_43690 [Nocardioides albus]